jgi:hypothetical protein
MRPDATYPAVDDQQRCPITRGLMNILTRQVASNLADA